MRALHWVGIFCLALLSLGLALTAIAQDEPGLAPDLIVLEAADTVRIEAPDSQPGLVSALSALLPRTVLDHADTVRQLMTAEPATPLAAALAATKPRLTAEYASGLREVVAVSAPPALQVLLDAVAVRPILEAASHNRVSMTEYPKALLADQKPPTVIQFFANGGRIHWRTDEDAASVVSVGLQSGAYTFTYTDPLFRIDHAMDLAEEIVTSLHEAQAAGVSETTYFVRIVSSDLSGNHSTSQEFTADTHYHVYLPTVAR